VALHYYYTSPSHWCMHDSRGIEIVNFTISLALSAGTLMASAGTPYRLVPVHFYPCQRVIFKLCMTVYKCRHGLAPKYLAELCVPVADVAGRRHLSSASRGLLNFPRYNVSNYGRRAFCFAGPYVWNSLPEHIRQSTLGIVELCDYARA